MGLARAGDSGLRGRLWLAPACAGDSGLHRRLRPYTKITSRIGILTIKAIIAII